jgi:hypothetical protein
MRLARFAALVFVALLASTALAMARPTITAPAHSRVGGTVHVHASHLRKGRYALVLAADYVSARDLACVARLGRVSGRFTQVSFAATIPPKLTCWTNNTVRNGRIETKPGHYHLIVGVPNGPAGFQGSFVRAPLVLGRP